MTSTPRPLYYKTHWLAVVVVKWSACLPSIPTIRVRIPLKPKVFLENLCLKGTKINKKGNLASSHTMLIQHFSFDHLSYATLGLDSTWMGDCFGTRGIASF